MSAFHSAYSFLLDYGGLIMSGISGLFAAFRERFTGKFAKMLPLLGVILGIVWSVLSANNADQKQRQKLEDTVNRVDTYIRQQGAEVVRQVDVNTRSVLDQFVSQIQGVKPSVIKSASLADVQGLIKTGELAASSVRNIQPADREKLTIWVFPHVQEEVDYSVVKARLEQIAAHVVTRDLRQKVAPTNSVWYGGGADLAQAKAVALTVASAGIHIRQICPSRLQVPQLVQVGGSYAVEHSSLPILTTEQINSLNSPVCSSGESSD